MEGFKAKVTVLRCSVCEMLLDGKSVACAFCEAMERIARLEERVHDEHTAFLLQYDKREELKKKNQELRSSLDTATAWASRESLACSSYAERVNKLREALHRFAHCDFVCEPEQAHVIAKKALDEDLVDAGALALLQAGSAQEEQG